jgi:hypothetical protein
MADYHPLIARAVQGLDKSTGEARRALYERARTALVAQLRGVSPALSESEITKERLALEEAIRKVEAEAARKSREPPPRASPRATAEPMRDTAAAQALPPRRERQAQTQAPPPAAASGRRGEARVAEQRAAEQNAVEQNMAEAPRDLDAPEPEEAPRAAPPAPARTGRSRWFGERPSSLSSEALKGFRNVVGEVDELGAATAKSAKSARENYAAPAPAAPVAAPRPAERRFEPRLDPEELRASNYDTSQLRSLEPLPELDDEEMPPPAARPRPPPPREPEMEEEFEPAPRRSYGGLIRMIVLLVVLAGLAATVAWQWPNIIGAYNFVTQLGRSPPSQATREAPQARPKIPDRVGQDSGQARPGQAPAVAQRVVLYEEDANDPQGKRFVGSAIWRTETISPGAGLAPELAVRADIEIPERRITMTWSLRRNTDQALPASHTVEIMFNLPADFPGGGIANVPGILMKQAEQSRGTPLAGLAVKVTTGFFLIGLSAVEADVARNVQLLKERSWFDIPVVYNNGSRAILAMEKGTPGERAFAEAFAAWGK